VRSWCRCAGSSEGQAGREHASLCQQALVAAGHDVDTVLDEGLAGASDPQVVAAATVTGRLLITLDRGLGDIRKYPPGGHAGILVLRPPDQSATTVAAALAELIAGQDLHALDGTITVAQRGLLRIRRPQ
jgi:predicted nuclease of predicted toxin-antitoxin system